MIDACPMTPVSSKRPIDRSQSVLNTLLIRSANREGLAEVTSAKDMEISAVYQRVAMPCRIPTPNPIPNGDAVASLGRWQISSRSLDETKSRRAASGDPGGHGHFSKRSVRMRIPPL